MGGGGEGASKKLENSRGWSLQSGVSRDREGGLTQPKIRMCGWRGGDFFSIKWLKLEPRNNGGGREGAFFGLFHFGL